MANQSILKAFERMWQHVLTALVDKADKSELEESKEKIRLLETKVSELEAKLQTAIFLEEE